MKPLRADIPPAVAARIRRLSPEIKRTVRSVLEALCADPTLGEPLQRDLAGLWKYRVRRYRIVYVPDYRSRTLRVLAVGRRANVYADVDRLLANLDDPGSR